MLFHSQAFVLLFLPLTLVAFYLLAARTVAREWALIAASVLFYAAWDARFVPLLLGHIGVTWLLARAFGATGRRGLLHAGIVLNLASLGLFKYTQFALDVLAAATGLSTPHPTIVLPIGISFFTFQCVSYLVDLGRGEAPQYPLRRLTLFVALFAHLIAGPIVRHSDIMGQFDRDPLRPGLAERLSRGFTLFVIGLVLKVQLADRLAVCVDAAFAAAITGAPNVRAAWAAMGSFALQIYFDFSAYSEMAIGLALLLGLDFPRNFEMPYRATSLRRFWQRWHLSLSRFLRDYLYIALGGNRHGPLRWVAATMTTMGLCGLWHGAAWPFVLWGLLHGGGLLADRLWRAHARPMPTALAWPLTVLFVAFAFVLFRAPNLAIFGQMVRGLLGQGELGAAPSPLTWAVLAVGAALAVVPWSNVTLVERFARPSAPIAVATAVIAVLVLLKVGRGAPSSFLYFQF